MRKLQKNINTAKSWSTTQLQKEDGCFKIIILQATLTVSVKRNAEHYNAFNLINRDQFEFCQKFY